MKKRLIMRGDNWADNWDEGSGYCAEVEAEIDTPDPMFRVLDASGNRIPKPAVKFGFWPK